jgi:hypothetical protein
MSNHRSNRALRTPLAVLVGALVLLGVFVTPGRAEAHRNDESYLYLDIGDTALSGRVELPYRDVREVFGLELTGRADSLRDELAANYDQITDYLLSTTSIGTGGATWPIRFDGDVELLEEGDVGDDGLGYALLPFDVELDVDAVPEQIDVTFVPFLAEIENRNNITLIANDWQRGVVEEETNELIVHTLDEPSGTVNLGESNQWGNFRRSIDLGVDHIRTGPDHIFFVMVLLLPSVLVIVLGTWRPVDRFSTALIRVVIVATMFTVAHSITFTLAGLDLLPLPPSKLVETLIALSIAAAALHNIKPVFGHREWLIAFVFGLFHGMGFAGLVQELDINRSTQLVSLLGRNVGIEIGQLVIIAITFPALFLLRRTRVYLPLMYTGSIVLAALSLTWVYERITETEVGINGLVDRVILWPRSFWAMVVVTALSAVVYAVERRADRLLPVFPAHQRDDASNDDEQPPRDDAGEVDEPVLV